MLNLLLVQPVDSYGPNKFLPLAISYQWVFAKTDPWIAKNWQIVDVIIEKTAIKKYVENLSKVDLAAFSCYVWNWSYNLNLAKEIKKKFPDCKIVIGGPNVNKHDYNFLKENFDIDYAIIGEGEIAFQSLLKSYSGTIIKENNFLDSSLTNSSFSVRHTSLDDIPSPILSGFYDEIFNLYKNRFETEPLWQVTFETLRGCPYHCAFCDIGDSYWNKVKTFHLDRVKKEIDWMSKNKIEYVSVCDSNWGMLDRDKEITRYVINKKKQTGYPKIWDVTWAKNNSERIFEIAKIENREGTKLFKGVTFAMQSFNQSTLSATSRFNINQDTVNFYLKKYQEENIATYSELIWPMPNETVNSLMLGIQKLIFLGQKDFLMVHPLVLTPNSLMGQKAYREKWKLKAVEVPLDTFYLKIKDSENYITEYTEAVISTNSATYNDVLDGHLYAYVIITFFYYGWAYAIMEYLFNKKNIKHIDVAKDIIDYFSNSKTLIGSEIIKTRESLNGVFKNKDFWGRMPTENIDVLWDYKGASSIVFDLNRKQLKKELKDFLHNRYNVKNPCLLDINDFLCFDYRKKYPIVYSGNQETINNIFNLNTDKIIFNHFDKNYKFKSAEEFHYKAYHYQRKNRYWKCTVQEN